MTVLIVLCFLLLVALLCLAIGVASYLFRSLMELQQSIGDRIMGISRDVLKDAHAMAERTPAELQKLLTHVTKSQEQASKNLITMVQTAWNPAPTPPVDQNTDGRSYMFPIPLGADESIAPDRSDPTDAYLPPHADYRPDGLVVDAPIPQSNPFGLPGVEFKDPLAGLAGKHG